MTSTESGSNSLASDGDAIKVLVRCRPPEYESEDHGTCLGLDPSQSTVTMLSKPEPKVFTFDSVVETDCSQETIFGLVGKRTIENAVDGYNGTIFAYGQTGSGKTFTMLGPSEDSDNFHSHKRGVIPRSFEYLFNLIHRKRETHGSEFDFLCRCSFLEIYNEAVFDLLDASSSVLHLRENMKRGVFVEGITEIVVDSAADAYQVLTNGWMNRRVASTSMNRESSRSHAVFTVHLESKRGKEGVQKMKRSQLHLVDLAGSERQKDTQASGQRLKEAGKINQSLSVLGHVIMALGDIAHGKSRYVPYRDSKLTFLLRNSLGGNAKTHIIACVHSGSRCFGESLSTLQFVKRAKLIKNKAVMNEDTQGSIVQLQAEIKKLRDTVQQLQSQMVPQSLTAAPTGAVERQCPVQPGAPPGGEWRNKFLQAMLFRERLLHDHNALLEKVTKLEDLAKKKEKFLQSTKMIVKFRENNIARLEKKVKETCTEDELRILAQETNTDLKCELGVLRQQLNSNPVVVQYAKENQNLRREVKRLQTAEDVVAVLKKNELTRRELEAAYADLIAHYAAPSVDSSLAPAARRSVTPLSESNLAVATVEKFKSQLAVLQAQLDTTKQEHCEQRQLWEKTKLDLESSLAAHKAANTELEKVLVAHHLKSKIERDVMNDMHLQTIKTITTPKKAYSLRNLDVPRPLGEPIDFNLSGGELDIHAEEEPEHSKEQAYEAFTDEIRKLQDKNSKLSEAHAEMESIVRQLKQANSKLEHELAQLHEIVSQERREASETQQELRTRNDSLMRNLETTTVQKNMYESEVEDLRLVVQSLDKERAESRDKLAANTGHYQQQLDQLQTKVIQLESELHQVLRDYDASCEDKEELQDLLDNARATLSFREDRLAEVEAALAVERQKVTLKVLEIQSHAEKWAEQQEVARLLREQMQQQGQDKEQALLRLMEESSSLQERLSHVQSELDRANSAVHNTLADRAHLGADNQGLRRQLSENKEAMNVLMNQLQTQRANIQLRDEDIEELSAGLESRDVAIQLVTADNDRLRQQVESMTSQLCEMTSEWEEFAVNHELELQKMNEENQRTNDAYSKLEAEYVSVQEELESLSADVELRTSEIATVKQQVSGLRQQVSDRDRLLMEKGQGERQHSQETMYLQLLVKQQCEEINGYKSKQSQLNQLFGELEDSRKHKNDEIAYLRVELSVNEAEKGETERLNGELKKMLQRMECEHRLKVEMDETLVQQKTELKEQNQRLQARLDQATSLACRADNDKTDMLQRLEKLSSELTLASRALSEKTEDVDRLHNLAQRDHGEKLRLESVISEALEYKSKIQKELEEVKEANIRITEENTKLVGHQNLNQKIQYHYTTKQENARLREVCTTVCAQCAGLLSQCQECSQHVNDQTGNCSTAFAKCVDSTSRIGLATCLVARSHFRLGDRSTESLSPPTARFNPSTWSPKRADIEMRRSDLDQTYSSLDSTRNLALDGTVYFTPTQVAPVRAQENSAASLQLENVCYNLRFAEEVKLGFRAGNTPRKTAPVETPIPNPIIMEDITLKPKKRVHEDLIPKPKSRLSGQLPTHMCLSVFGAQGRQENI